MDYARVNYRSHSHSGRNTSAKLLLGNNIRGCQDSQSASIWGEITAFCGYCLAVILELVSEFLHTDRPQPLASELPNFL
jgi:hypothetical protein